MLRGETCDFVTDVSGQPIGPIFKSEAVREKNCIISRLRQNLPIFWTALQHRTLSTEFIKPFLKNV
jgi:hypothetical protein